MEKKKNSGLYTLLFVCIIIAIIESIYLFYGVITNNKNKINNSNDLGTNQTTVPNDSNLTDPVKEAKVKSLEDNINSLINELDTITANETSLSSEIK